jgi:hypothetical protein
MTIQELKNYKGSHVKVGANFFIFRGLRQTPFGFVVMIGKNINAFPEDVEPAFTIS